MLTDKEFDTLFMQTGFSTPRNQQKEVILKVIDAFDSGKKYVIVNAPVGFGKSGSSYAISKHYHNSYFLTHQRFLQDQYYNDFGMPTISSSLNYTCNLMSYNTCKHCFKIDMGMKRCDDCPYILAKNKAFASRECSSNYAFIFTLTSFMDKTNIDDAHRQLIVCDECHKVPSEIISRCTLEIDYDKNDRAQNIVVSTNQLTLPNFSLMNNEEIIDYVQTKYRSFCQIKIDEADCEIKKFMTKKLTKIAKSKEKQFKRLQIAKNFYSQQITRIDDMFEFIMHSIDDVVITKTEKGITIKPLSASGMFEKLIGQFGEKFLFMSGTILDKEIFCKELGLDSDMCEYISIDSSFPKENRPIYYIPVGSMNFKDKNETIPIMNQAIDQILNHYPNDKGIIHTTNYDLNNSLKEYMMKSNNFIRLLFVDASNKDSVLNQFKKSDFPYVLVSPSLSEGLDLKDDLSRLCIICKVPYASLMDEWVKQKVKSDRRWYTVKTAETLIQQTGRSVRSENDHADTFILDTQFRNFYLDNHDLFPRWWSESIKWDVSE